MIKSRVARRAYRSLALWRNRKAEIQPMPAGKFSVPSCSEFRRSYQVSLVGEGRCDCTDWWRCKQLCKHIFGSRIGRKATGSASLQI